MASLETLNAKPNRNLNPMESVSVEKLELSAPGHRYDHRTGTGIEWLPPDPDTGEGVVRLWARRWGGESRVIAKATHRMTDPRAYWRDLGFVWSFPEVTHWWFGSAWTGRVWISRPVAVVGRDLLTGWMRFGDEEEPWLPWTATAFDPVLVRPSLPPLHVSALNLPLQTALAQLIVSVLRGDRAPEQEEWVTGLIRREDLETAFPTDFAQSWRLDGGRGMTVREAFCIAQDMGSLVALI